MRSREFLQEVLKQYEGTFDLYMPYTLKEETYDAYGYFYSCIEKYMLTRGTQMWKADSYEHVLFLCREQPMKEDADKIQNVFRNDMEPVLVRKGESTMPKDHMCSYMTVVLLCDSISDLDIVRRMKRIHFLRHYKFDIRGYSEARVVIVDIKNQKVYSNWAGRSINKFYRNLLKMYAQASK